MSDPPRAQDYRYASTLPTLGGNSTVISALLQLVDEPVVILDLDGRIAGLNHGVEQLLGRPPSEMLGEKITNLLPEEARTAFLEHLHGLVSGIPHGAFEATLRARSGDWRTVQALLNYMPGSAEIPGSILCRLLANDQPGTLGDISSSQLRHLWVLLDSVPVSFSYLDTSRRFLYVNNEGRRYIPEHSVNVIGMHISDVFGPEMYERLKPQIDQVLSGQESTSEVSLTRRDGTRRHFFRHLYPDKTIEGVVKGYFSVLVDISEAKITQESQLRREHLLRSTLVREINHRVKNSLQGLIGIMRMYEARRPQATPLMDQFVSQLMAVAVAFGLASKHGDARILLCEMVHDIAKSVEQVSRRRVEVQLLPGVASAPVALSEQHSANISLVVNELIFNAIKHSAQMHDQGTVHVQVDRHGDSALLKVINPAGLLPEGFSFAEGTGLGTGLNLVKVLVPPDSCSLKISQEAEGVVAELRLHSPVLACQ